MKWSKEQLKIINHDDKKILVKAGAGTGKTAIIIQRVLSLLQKDPTLNINDFAIITFTNKATEEIQARLKAALYSKWRTEKNIDARTRYRRQIEALNITQISTIHMFCHSILEKIGPYQDDQVSYAPSYKISSSLLYDSIEDAIERWVVDNTSKDNTLAHLDINHIYAFKRNMRKLYSEIRAKGLDIDKIISETFASISFETKSQIRSLKKEIVDVISYLKAEHKKYKHGRIDVDDLLELSAHILAIRSDLKIKIQKQYKHIIVDEFQDTSFDQSKLIESICDESEIAPSLFVVGDKKQSIYKFRGADLDSYSRISEWIKRKGSVLNLQTNWRSTPDVVAYVNNVFEQIQKDNKYEFKHERLNFRPTTDNTTVLHFKNARKWLYGDKYKHGEIIADYLMKKKRKGEKLGNYTILVRGNYQLDYIESGFKKKKFENYHIVGVESFYKQKIIVHLYKLLKSLLYPENYLLRSEASNTIFFNDDREYSNLLEIIKSNNYIYELTPAQLIHLIVKETSVDKETGLIKGLGSDEKVILQKLQEKTRSLFMDEHITLSQYLKWLNLMIVTDQDESIPQSSTTLNDVVQVMTIHRAKGLEFPTVILPFLNENLRSNILYPELLIDQNKNVIECRYKSSNGTVYESNYYEKVRKRTETDIYSEELRVLYVALTRAERKLILVGDKTSKTGVNFQNWLLNN